MRVTLSTPIIVSTESGDVSCTEAETMLAFSDSIALRADPVGPDGTVYQSGVVSVVGGSEIADIATFIDTVKAAMVVLITGRQ